jgi:hypothetical protein
MSDQFEKYIGNIFKQLNEHEGDAAEDQKLKETMRSILRFKGVEVPGLVEELFNAFQTHLAKTKGQ